MKKAFLFILFLCLSSACSQNVDNIFVEEEQEGFIVKIEQEESAGHGHKGWYSMLVIPNIEDIDISKKTDDELVRLAQEKNGAYYGVSPDLYHELELDIGMRVIVYWNGSQGDSDPPVRDADQIDIQAESK